MAHNVITHNGKEVLFINHRGLTGEELFNSFKAANMFMLEQKKKYLIVSDFTDTTGTKELNSYIQGEESKEVSKYIIAQAIVGLTGVKKMVLRVYNALTGVKSHMFDTVEEALDFIITQ